MGKTGLFNVNLVIFYLSKQKCPPFVKAAIPRDPNPQNSGPLEWRANKNWALHRTNYWATWKLTIQFSQLSAVIACGDHFLQQRSSP